MAKTDFMDPFIKQLYRTLVERKSADPSSSYVAALYAKGTDSILKKVGEEATEVIIAGKGDDDSALIYEISDLLFHGLVLLASRGLSPELVIEELKRREGISGIVEKASRG